MGISRIGNITGYGQIASGKRINRAADDAAGYPGKSGSPSEDFRVYPERA